MQASARQSAKDENHWFEFISPPTPVSNIAEQTGLIIIQWLVVSCRWTQSFSHPFCATLKLLSPRLTQPDTCWHLHIIAVHASPCPRAISAVSCQQATVHKATVQHVMRDTFVGLSNFRTDGCGYMLESGARFLLKRCAARTQDAAML